MIMIAVSVSMVALGAAMTATSSAPVAGANITDKAPIYNDSNQNVSFRYWFPGGNASLDSIGDMASRVLPAIIGTGEQDPSGSGYQGVLLMGLVFAGSSLVAVMGTGVGPVGGTVIGLVLSYGLIAIGLAPQWLTVVVLFGIGIAAAVAALRITRA